MAELNLDAKNAIMGRLATYAVKQALLGNTVNVFNCEKAIITGDRHKVRDRYYKLMFDLGQPTKGPFMSRMPDRFVRRVIRGMVEYKKPRGKDAFKRIMCYIGVPAQFKDKELTKVGKDASQLPSLKYQTVETLCVSLGGKV